MTERRKAGTAIPIAATVAALLALYVGAYYATVRPIHEIRHPTAFYVWPMGHRFSLNFQRRATMFFAPFHWLDCRLRPHVWDASKFEVEM